MIKQGTWGKALKKERKGVIGWWLIVDGWLVDWLIDDYNYRRCWRYVMTSRCLHAHILQHLLFSCMQSLISAINYYRRMDINNIIEYYCCILPSTSFFLACMACMHGRMVHFAMFDAHTLSWRLDIINNIIEYYYCILPSTSFFLHARTAHFATFDAHTLSWRMDINNIPPNNPRNAIWV